MLDAFIIDQLQKERERSRSSYIPLYIEPPRPTPEPLRPEETEDDEPREESPSHGVVIIDYFSDDES